MSKEMESSDSTAVRFAARKPRWAAGSLDATRQSMLTRLRDPADREGWQRFFDMYGGVIHGLGIRAGLTPTEAEEALQETLVSVAHEMPGFRYDPELGSFKGWLFRITRRRIADQFRRRIRVQQVEGGVANEASAAGDLSEDPLSRTWDEEWHLNRLHRAIDQVKQRVAPAQWQIFDLATLQEMATGDVCALLGVNRAQVYVACMRIRRLLRAELEESPEG